MLKLDEKKIMEFIKNQNFIGIENYIESEIIMQTKTNKSEMQQIKAFKSLAKKIYKEKIKNNPGLAGAWEFEEKTNICDGFRVVRLNKKISEIGEIDKVDSGLQTLDVSQFFKVDYTKFKKIPFDKDAFILQYNKYKTIPLKDRNRNKEEKIFKIDCTEFIAGFNIQYLKDLNDIMDLSKCELYMEKNISPLFIINEMGDAILLPIW